MPGPFYDTDRHKGIWVEPKLLAEIEYPVGRGEGAPSLHQAAPREPLRGPGQLNTLSWAACPTGESQGLDPETLLDRWDRSATSLAFRRQHD